MNNNPNNDNFKLEITKDKLIDILMHAATREDISKLDSKVDASIARLENKIDSLKTNDLYKLDQKIDASIARLENKIDSLKTNDLCKLDQKIDAKFTMAIWTIIGSVVTTAIGLGGLMITLLHK